MFCVIFNCKYENDAIIPILTNAMEGLKIGANCSDATCNKLVTVAVDLIMALALLLCK